MSFETPGWSVAPPPSVAADVNKKRKRPSAAADAKIDSASVNLERLMSLMDKEDQASKGAKAEKKSKEKEKAKAKAGEKQQKGGEKPKGKPQQQQPAKEGGGQGAKAQGNGKKDWKKEKKQEGGGAQVGKAPSAAPPTPTASKPYSKAVPSPAPSAAPVPAGDASSEPPKKKSKKDKKKDKTGPTATSAALTIAPDAPALKSEAANTVVIPSDEDMVVSDLPAGLTPMQAKMKGRLEGARFRWINEQLYTSSSDTALEMMRSDPSIFSDYHSGFRHQTLSWPTSPVVILTDTLTSLLPSSSLIIDLGCGDAALAQALTPQGYKVLSYDLVGDKDWVVEADYCGGQGLGLPGGAGRVVDAAVCCLSLMGRNWVEGVKEIARVLKDGGHFEIAEAVSRMPSVDDFISLVSSLGFTLRKKDDSNTHFILLSFDRSGEQTWDEGGASWDEIVKKGETVLKACVYKKR